MSIVNRRKAMGAALVAALAALASGGCGQKGPLFLPEEKLDELERKKRDKEQRKSSMRSPGGSARHG